MLMNLRKQLGLAFKQMQNSYETAHPTLHQAASEGETIPVARLLADGAEIDAVDVRGYTALHWAVLGGSKPVAQLLLDHGANVDAQDHQGNTPLHYAAQGHLALASLLLERGAKQNMSNNNGDTPLMLACSESGETGRKLLLLPDRRKVAELLRERGATD